MTPPTSAAPGPAAQIRVLRFTLQIEAELGAGDDALASMKYVAGWLNDNGYGYVVVEEPAVSEEEPTMDRHEHNAFLCPAHVRGCDCPNPSTSLCNPYMQAGFCPDDISVMPEGCPLA